MIEIGKHRVTQGSMTGPQVETLFNERDRVHILYSDLPWGDSMLKQFATSTFKATGVRPAQPTYAELLKRLHDLIKTYVSGHVFIETSVKLGAETADAIAPALGGNVQVIPTKYGPDLSAVLLYGTRPGVFPKGFSVDGLKGLPMVKACLAPFVIPDALVFDPCCGAGYTAKASAFHGMRFRGNELNPARLKKTMEFLRSA